MKDRKEQLENSKLSPQPLWIHLLEKVGAPAQEQLSTLQDVLGLFLRALRDLLKPASWRWNEILQSVAQISFGSLPIIAVSTAFSGMIVTNEIAWHLDAALHSTSMVPGVTGQFILRELGVAIPAMLLVSKVGAATTAEVSTMKITDQIDALKLLGIDPFTYLVMPRFIAAILVGPCLTLIAVCITLFFAMEIASFRFNLSTSEYINSLRHFVGMKDLYCAFVKGTVYSAMIPLISCAYGFRCKGGAEGVGTSTTRSVVAATVGIILFDFILTYLFSHIF